MKTVWFILVLALVLNESCNGATVKNVLHRERREFVIPQNLDEILEEQKDEISPGVRKVLGLLTKNVTEEEFFAALLAIDPSELEPLSTRPEMVEGSGSGDYDTITDDEDLGEGSGEGSGEGPLEGQDVAITNHSFTGSPGFGPGGEPLGSTPSPELLALLLQGQGGGASPSPDDIAQLLQMQEQGENTPSPEMLALILQQQQQMAQGQDGNSTDLENLALILQSQQGPEEGVPSPEVLSLLLQQHGQQVGQEGTPSPEFLAMILRLQQEQEQNSNDMNPFPVPVASGESPFGEEAPTTCKTRERKGIESILLCEEITRPIYEECFSEAGLVVELPFVSSPADFTDGRPIQAVLNLLEEGTRAFRNGSFGSLISEFDRTVREADIANEGSIKACMQRNMKEDIYDNCNASSKFECYMESCVETKSRNA